MTALTINNFLAVPEVAMLLMVSTILLVSLFAGKSSELITYSLSVLALLVTAALIYFVPQQSMSFFDGLYINDGLAIATKIFVCLTVALVFVYARPYLMHRKNAKPEFYILGLFATLGMLVMASAHNFITIYLGLELLSLCMYALVAYMRDSNQASEAAIKYFVLGAIASGMLLYGMSILYGLSGTLELAELGNYLDGINEIDIALVFALTFVIIGVAFKFGAVPFHMWMPDVYQGAPTAVTLFVATAPKFAAFVMAMRLLNDGMQNLLADWQGMLIILAALSLIFGNVIAIAQNSIKRMLAYSTISHIGFVLLGLLTGEAFGYAAALFYTAIYVLMSAGAFGVLCALSNENRDVDQLDDLQGLSASHPWLALVMLVVMFSMAGMPLTVGFYAKLYVLQSLVGSGLIWLAVLAVVMSIVGAFYYLRVIKLMYFDTAKDTLTLQTTTFAQVLLLLNGTIILALFIFPNPVLNYCIQAIG